MRALPLAAPCVASQKFGQQRTNGVGKRDERVVEPPARTICFVDVVRNGAQLERGNTSESGRAQNGEPLHPFDLTVTRSAHARAGTDRQDAGIRQSASSGGEEVRIGLDPLMYERTACVFVDRRGADHDRPGRNPARTCDAHVKNRIGKTIRQCPGRARSRLHRPDAAGKRLRRARALELALGRGDDEKHGATVSISVPRPLAIRQRLFDAGERRFLAVMSASKLKIRRLTTDRATVSLRGDHDSYSATRVERGVRALLDEGYDVEIDLRRATFVDSVTIGALIEAHRYARERDRRLTVTIGESTGWAVRRLFELTQLDSLLTVLAEG